MSKSNDSSLNPDDRTEWDRAWRAMPHRRLSSPPKIAILDSTFSALGDPVSFTISEDPPEYQDRAWRASDRCPICGENTSDGERLPASLYPSWASGLSVGIGVWVHQTCFAACPEAGEPAPIPW